MSSIATTTTTTTPTPNFNRLAIHGHRGWASSAIVDACARTGCPIKILARPSSDLSGLPDLPNVSAVVVDLEDEAALVQELAETDILISLVGHSTIANQFPLINAVSKSSVKLFVPSDLGFQVDEEGEEIPILKAKKDVVRAAEAKGVKTLEVTVGVMAESTFGSSMLGIDLARNKIVYTGDSENQPLNICTLPYIAQAYAQIFPTTPLADLLTRPLIPLSEFQATGRQITSAMTQLHHGSPPTILRQSLASVDEQIRLQSPLALAWFCRKVWAVGRLVELVVGRGKVEPWEVRGWKKRTLESVIVDGENARYRDLPQRARDAFDGMMVLAEEERK